MLSVIGKLKPFKKAMGRNYVLKESGADHICFAVVSDKISKDSTMMAFKIALEEQFNAECETPNIDLSLCHDGKSLEFIAKLKDEDGERDFDEYSIEVEETVVY